MSKRRSVVFTAIIFVGLVIALAGVGMLILGVGGATTFSFSMGDFEVETTSVGLAVLAVGAAMSAFLATNLPEGVQVFGPTERTFTDKLSHFAPVLWGVAAVAVLLLALSVLL